MALAVGQAETVGVAFVTVNVPQLEELDTLQYSSPPYCAVIE
jgi:hypothetical protein